MVVVSVWLIGLVTCHVASAFSATPRVFVSTPSKRQRFVSDYMTPNPRTLSTTTSVDEAIATLLDLGVSSAPVVDESGTLVGLVSASDFLHKEAGSVILPMEGTNEAEVLNKVKKIIGQKVGDLMTNDLFTIDANASMRTAAALMAQEKLHSLPVIDDDDKLVGVISTFDVMRDVLSTVRATLPPADDSSAP